MQCIPACVCACVRAGVRACVSACVRLDHFVNISTTVRARLRTYVRVHTVPVKVTGGQVHYTVVRMEARFQ